MLPKKFTLLFALFLLVPSIVACSGGQTSDGPVLTPPAIGVQITRDDCPSIEIRAGMQISWTNQDDVNRVVLLERTDENGTLIDSGGTDLLQPGSTFSITLTEPGQYTYYCSEDRTAFGMITVLPLWNLEAFRTVSFVSA